MKNKHTNKKRSKHKLKRLTWFIAVCSVLFIMTTAYAIMQFEAGREDSENEIASSEMDSPIKRSEASPVEVKLPENDEPINVLLIGVDTKDLEPARTDTIMIAQYDAINGEAKLASIMRDTYVEIPGYSNNKINAAFAFGGADLLRQTIELTFNIDIHYYAMVNFDGFIKVVDTIAPSGLDVTIDKRMYYHDPTSSTVIDFQPGLHTLDGEQVLNFVRYRSDSQNDFGRVQRQQETLTLLKDELMSLSGLTRVPRLIGAVEPHLETNIRISQMFSLGRDFVLNPITSLKTLRIPVDNGYQDQHYSHAGAVLEMDLEKNIQAINDFLSVQSSIAKKTIKNKDESLDSIKKPILEPY